MVPFPPLRAQVLFGLLGHMIHFQIVGDRNNSQSLCSVKKQKNFLTVEFVHFSYSLNAGEHAYIYLHIFHCLFHKLLQLCKSMFLMRLQVSYDQIKVISLESAKLKGFRHRTDTRDLHSSPLKLWDFVQQPANRSFICIYECSEVKQGFSNFLMTRTLKFWCQEPHSMFMYKNSSILCEKNFVKL